MSVTLWYVDGWSKSPVEKIYARETARFAVRADGRRDAKETTWSKLYPSYDEALAAIQRRIEGEESRERAAIVRKAGPDLLEALEAIILSADAGRAAVPDQLLDRARAAASKAKGLAK